MTERLERILREPASPAPERLGRLAVMGGFITLPQLEEALAEQDLQATRGGTPDRLGQILIRRGWIDEKTLQILLERQAPRPEFKRYEIRRRLGEGAMSVVYEAADRELGRPVAFKLLREALSLHPAARENLRQEAQALARLSHPNVVAVYDFAEEAGQAGVVMELMEGRSLRSMMGEPTRALLELLEKVARGVQHAHEHGIIHRDLKPENILVSATGEPKVADFGLARHVDTSATGSRKGTPRYMAPEQVEGHEITPRTDVYALGVMLYELLAGRPPFVGETLAEVFSRILTEEPPPIRGDLGTIALKAIEKDPARRYASAREFADELRRHLSGEAIVARPAGAARRIYRRLRKRPFLAGLAIGTLVAVFLWLSAADAREKALAAYRELARSTLNTALTLRRGGQNDQIPAYLPALEASYRQVAELAPDSPEPHYLMGRFQRVLLRDDAALKFQEEALRKDPSYAPALYERILLLSRRHKGQLEGDLQSVRNRLLADCDRLGETSAAAARGIVAFHRGRLDEAVLHLKEAVAKDPLLEEAWETLVEATIERPVRSMEEMDRSFQEAERLCGQARSIDRGYLPHLQMRAEIRHIRGDARMVRGLDPLPDFAGAEQDFAEALRFPDGRLNTLRGRGDLLTTRGLYRKSEADLAAAEADYNEGLRLRPGNFALLRRRGLLRIHRGNLEGAERDLVEATRLPREDPILRNSLGLVRMLQGDLDQAEKEFTEALRISPEYTIPWRDRGLLRMRRGQLAAAEDDFTRGIQAGRETPGNWLSSEFVPPYVPRARLRLERGDRAGARQDLERALAFNPNDAEARALREKLGTP